MLTPFDDQCKCKYTQPPQCPTAWPSHPTPLTPKTTNPPKIPRPRTNLRVLAESWREWRSFARNQRSKDGQFHQNHLCIATENWAQTGRECSRCRADVWADRKEWNRLKRFLDWLKTISKHCRFRWLHSTNFHLPTSQRRPVGSHLQGTRKAWWFSKYALIHHPIYQFN